MILGDLLAKINEGGIVDACKVITAKVDILMMER
jgi:hypothetical protein